MILTFADLLVWMIVGMIAGSLAGAAVKRTKEGFGRYMNMGIGLVLVVRPFYADSVRRQLSEAGYENWTIGRIEEGTKGALLQ